MSDERRTGDDRRAVQQLREELALVRPRWHKTADAVQAHEGRLVQLEWRLHELEKQVTTIEGEMKHLVTGAQLDNLSEMLDLRLKHLTETLEPIRRGFNWAIGVIVAAVVVALLSLVVRGGG